MQIFYTPEIAVNLELPEEEAGHCIRVLRLTEGDEILLTDGKGFFFKAAISRAHPKHCEVNILEQWEQPALWNFNLHIAVAPTKNMDRMEWFAEKATEIGINAITCLNCRPGENALVLIGPEGDFSPEEIALALKCGFEPISLGESRLRTETAALVACHTIHVLNQ